LIIAEDASRIDYKTVIDITPPLGQALLSGSRARTVWFLLSPEIPDFGKKLNERLPKWTLCYRWAGWRDES
jgi:hypothetical protein